MRDKGEYEEFVSDMKKEMNEAETFIEIYDKEPALNIADEMDKEMAEIVREKEICILKSLNTSKDVERVKEENRMMREVFERIKKFIEKKNKH